MATDLRRTTCNRDCPDACGVVATVEDGRVTALRGDSEHPVTKGFLCFRTSRFLDHQNDPKRLTQALLRVDGELRPVPYARAIEVAAEKLRQIREESGPAAVFHYRSGGSLGLLKSFADRFFEGFGPVTVKSGDICSGAGEEAQLLDFGVSDSNELFDLENARHVFLWGKNPFASNIHLIPVLKRCKANGATVTLIDPVHHKAVSLADRVVQPVPGGDLDLAFGIVRVLEETGRLPAEALAACDHVAGFLALVRERTADEYAAAAGVEPGLLAELADAFATGPAAILVGWGMQRRRHGGAIVRALDALSAVSGNLFRSGGGCSFYFGRRTAFDTIHDQSAARHVREPMFGPDVLAAEAPKIRMIWVTAGNPVCMLPDSALVDRALRETEFVVVVDPFLTDTGRRADLVIPTPTLLEDEDLVGAYGHHFLAASRPVVPPPEGVLHEVELFQELGRRLGPQPGPQPGREPGRGPGLEEHLAGSIREWQERMMGRLQAAGVELEALQAGPVKNPFARPVLFGDRKVRTPSGKVNLMTSRNGFEPVVEDAAFPLWLFSNSTEKSQASQWAGAGLGERTWVVVHPDAAAGLEEGDVVRVASATGTIEAELRFDAAQRKDIAIMPKGGHFDRGHSANVLIEARPTDIGLGAAYLDCRVGIRPV